MWDADALANAQRKYASRMVDRERFGDALDALIDAHQAYVDEGRPEDDRESLRDNMTMLALSLSIGILVDDAIVVIENIYRHLEIGKSKVQAAKDATSEIGLAVLATTMSIAPSPSRSASVIPRVLLVGAPTEGPTCNRPLPSFQNTKFGTRSLPTTPSRSPSPSRSANGTA